MTTATINGVALEDAVPEALVINVRRSLLGARKTVFQDVPGVAGSWVFGDRPGDRTITLTVHIQADDFAGRRDAVRRLAAWADTFDPATLVIDDEPDRAEYAILTSTPQPDEMLNTAQLDLEFRARPYAYALTTSTETWGATSGVAHTFTLPDTVEAPPIITLTAAAPCASWSLEVNGETLTYGTAMASGADVTVSTPAFVVYTGTNVDPDVVGSFDPATVSMAAVDGAFPMLSPGTNTVTVTAAGGVAMDVAVVWLRRYQ